MNTLVTKLRYLAREARDNVRGAIGSPERRVQIARADALEEALVLARREQAAFRRWAKKRSKQLDVDRKNAGNDMEMHCDVNGKDSMLEEIEDWITGR